MAPPVRFGLIGAGRWGKVYIRTLASLAERCRLTHLCTSRPDNASLVPHPVQVVSDWRALIASECDAVIIASPPKTHAEIVEACVEAKKPCLVEKPFCLDVATAERLHTRIQASGVPVLVDHTHLLTPTYRLLKDVLKEAGEPIRVLLSEGMGFGPFRTHTSTLWDWCPHDVSLCLDLLGRQPEHLEVLDGPRSPEGDPEMVTLRLDFSGQVCAWIHAGRLSAEKRRAFSVVTDRHLYVFDDLAPEQLTVAPIPFSHRYAEAVPEPVKRSLLAMAPDRPPMSHVMTYFLDGLAGGDRDRFGAGLALGVTRVLAACDEAMTRNRNRRG